MDSFLRMLGDLAMPDKPSHLIQKLRVQNFGCLRDVEIDLEPFTVLVGPNDSGKSMVLRAIEQISSSLNRENGWRSVFPGADRFVDGTFQRTGGNVEFCLQGESEAQGYQYQAGLGTRHGDHVTLAGEELTIGSIVATRGDDGVLIFQAWEGGPRIAARPRDDGFPLLHATVVDSLRNGWKDGETQGCADMVYGLHGRLGSFRRYHLIPERIRAEVPISSKRRASLAPDGFGLPKVFAELLHRKRELVERIEDALRKAVSTVQRVDVDQGEIVAPVQGASSRTVRQAEGPGVDGLLGDRAGQRVPVYQLEIVTSGNVRVPSELVSDGVLLYLAYLVIAMGEPRPSVLLLEEPETGIHPGLLERLIDLLKDLTKGEHGGPPVQVILTTHSPMLLNFVAPHEIRVVKRGSDGGTQISPFESAADLPRLLEYQGPGEIWVNLGEEYLTQTGSEA